MKKILYVTNITRNINSFFIPHINMLQNEGYVVDCACKIEGEHPIKKEKFNKKLKFFDIPFTRSPLSLNNIKALMKLNKIQKCEKYDVIHVHSPIAGIYTRLLKLKYPKVKFIYTAHGFHFYKGSSKLSWLVFGNIERIISRLTDILVTINTEDYETAKKFHCSDVRYIKGVGVDSKEFKILDEKEKIKIRELLGFKKEDFILIMVGEHNKNKNQIALIKAMEKINNKQIKAILIGDGEDIEKNKKYIKEKNIDNVFILGFRNDVNELINISDGIISLSHREGLPKNLLEAISIGKLGIVSNIRGNKDIITEKYNGYTTTTDDYDLTKEKIEELYNMSNEEKDKFSNNSKVRYKEFELENILEDLKKLY
ncbi:MAG: glycosyltransferase [Clostridium sp.]